MQGETSRRRFLGGACLAAAAARAAVADQSDKGPRWRTGLGLNGFMSSAHEFKKNYPLWEVLDYAADAGFGGVELVDGWPMGPYPPASEHKRVAALRRLYDQYGLRVYTFQTGGSGPYSADADARKNWLEAWRGYIDFATQLGCDFIGQWPGGGLAGNANVTEAIKRLGQSYREAATMCADAGLFLSFEIEPPFIFNTLEHLDAILAEADHPACKTNYDPSHFDLMWGSRGQPEAMLAKLGVEHIGHVHLTDTDGTIFAGTSKHVPCGDGHCDIRASLEVLWHGGFSGWIMIDGWKIEDVYRAAAQGKAAIDAAQAALSPS